MIARRGAVLPASARRGAEAMRTRPRGTRTAGVRRARGIAGGGPGRVAALGQVRFTRAQPAPLRIRGRMRQGLCREASGPAGRPGVVPAHRPGRGRRHQPPRRRHAGGGPSRPGRGDRRPCPGIAAGGCSATGRSGPAPPGGKRPRPAPGEGELPRPATGTPCGRRGGGVSIGEVSTVNGDLADNIFRIFRAPTGRLAGIGADEPPRHRLPPDIGRRLARTAARGGQGAARGLSAPRSGRSRRLCGRPTGVPSPRAATRPSGGSGGSPPRRPAPPAASAGPSASRGTDRPRRPQDRPDKR